MPRLHPSATLAALAALTAAPAAAQTPICGGISLVGQWAGGDETASDVSVADAPFKMRGDIPIAGHLVRMFRLGQAGPVRIDVAAVPAGDPYVAVFSADGQEVASDDDSGGDFASRVIADLGAGTYCLAARSYESGVTEVAVAIGRPDQFPDDAQAPTVGAAPEANGPPGGACFTADVARIGDAALGLDALGGGIGDGGTVGQRPAYGFVLDAATPLTVTATSENGDPLIRLLDADGTVLAENDDADGLNSRIDMAQPLQPGEYCVEVEDLNGTENRIEVALAAFDPVADRLRRIGEMEFAPTTADDVAVAELGALETALSSDVPAQVAAQWFALDVPAGGLLVIEAVGQTTDPEIKLFDRVGREVAYSDDGPDGLDSFLVHRALPGRYMLGLRVLDETPSGTVRLLMERYVPAR